MKYLNHDLAAGKREHVDASQFAQHKLQGNHIMKRTFLSFTKI